MSSPEVRATGGSAGLRVAPADIRLFTVEEAERLLGPIESLFREMDPRILRAREVRELIEDIESYYGEGLAGALEDERERHRALWLESQELAESLDQDTARINALGCLVKDVTMGLVDFHGTVDGEIVFLCWRRGEPGIGHYHPLHTGMAGRKPLPSAV